LSAGTRFNGDRRFFYLIHQARIWFINQRVKNANIECFGFIFKLVFVAEGTTSPAF